MFLYFKSAFQKTEKEKGVRLEPRQRRYSPYAVLAEFNHWSAHSDLVMNSAVSWASHLPLQCITVQPDYTAWYQTYMHVKNLPKVIT